MFSPDTATAYHVDFKVATLVHRSLSGNFLSYLAGDCRLVADARERRLCSKESRTCVVTTLGFGLYWVFGFFCLNDHLGSFANSLLIVVTGR